MADQNFTTYEVQGRAAWITLNTPEKRNALASGLVKELVAHVEAAFADNAVRVLVLTGAGAAFCAGADLKNKGDVTQDDSGGDTPLVQLLKLMWNGPKPVIGAINGAAFGGGVGLVAACDIAIASDAAKFSFSEVRIGVIPAIISVVVLPKIGTHTAMRLFLTGERFDAHQAQHYGLVHAVVPHSGLRDAVGEEVERVCLGGPIAIRESKNLVRTVPAMTMDEAFAWTEKKSASLFMSDEAAEGMAAFAEKRTPAWVESSDD